jgi:competence CoiA-like predicted nuclease
LLILPIKQNSACQRENRLEKRHEQYLLMDFHVQWILGRDKFIIQQRVNKNNKMQQS